MTDGSAGPDTWSLPVRWVERLGWLVLYIVESLGRFARFLGQAVALVFIPPLKLRRIDAVGRVAIACTRLLFEDAGGVPGDTTGIALGTFTAGLDSLVEYLDGLGESAKIIGAPCGRRR